MWVSIPTIITVRGWIPEEDWVVVRGVRFERNSGVSIEKAVLSVVGEDGGRRDWIS